MSTATLANDRLVSNAEAAGILGVTPGTLDVWRCTGRVPLAYVKVGRSVKYRLSELQRFVEARTVTPSSV